MKLWGYWGLLLISWVCSWISIGIWPKIDLLDLKDKSDLVTALLFHPFHYLVGFLFMVFFVFITSYILRKMIYECKVAFLFKEIPYESLLLFIFLVYVYKNMLLFYTYILLFITVIVAIYDIISYLPKRKEEFVYMRE